MTFILLLRYAHSICACLSLTQNVLNFVLRIAYILCQRNLIALLIWCTINGTPTARQATRRLATGAVRRAAKRQRASDSRGMHLSAAEIGTRQVFQRLGLRYRLQWQRDVWSLRQSVSTCNIPAPLIRCIWSNYLCLPPKQLPTWSRRGSGFGLKVIFVVTFPCVNICRIDSTVQASTSV